MMTKKDARQFVAEKLKDLSADYKKNANQEIQKQVFQLERYEKADTIFCFVSMENEVDTKPIIEDALSKGKCVGVPRCVGKHDMVVCKINGFEDLTPGVWGILEPKLECEILSKDEIQLGIIPCVSANQNGLRLGHGAGYYDRYLENSDFYKVLICWRELLLEEIPTDEYDVTMDQVIYDH